MSIEQIFKSKQTLENRIFYVTFFLNLLWFLPRCICALTILDFRTRYGSAFFKDTLMVCFIFSMIPIFKLMSRGFKDYFASLSIQEGVAEKILSQRFEPRILGASVIGIAYILYNYTMDYFKRLLFFSEYLGWLGYITQLAFVLVLFIALLFFSHFFVQLLFLNKAMPYIKIDLFHEDGFCGFQKMGKYFLKIAIIIFIIMSLIILLSIFSTSKKGDEERILYIVFSIVVTVPIAFAAFFYPQTGMKKAIEKQKTDQLHQLYPVLPHDPILTPDNLKIEEITIKLYNWTIYQRLEKVKLFQYDPQTLKKLFFAGLSPLLSGVLGLIVSLLL